uniref:Uncharacterized protein n=1 Tax=Strigamia maritima TaxID=126957 RepID=T1IJA7_STRMM
MNKADKELGLGISNTHYFQGGYVLFAVDLTPDSSTSQSHLSLVKQGNVRIEIRFGQALAQTITVLVYAKYQTILEVDRARNIVKVKEKALII